LGSYTRALLVSQDRRHLFVTPWVLLSDLLLLLLLLKELAVDRCDSHMEH
jgi:hypothetical protein